jgi:hypothetical protein
MLQNLDNFVCRFICGGTGPWRSFYAGILSFLAISSKKAEILQGTYVLVNFLLFYSKSHLINLTMYRIEMTDKTD